MAEIAWEPIDLGINGDAYRATGLAAGDNTAILTLNDADTDVTVHIYGVAAGSTISVKGGVNSLPEELAVVDDAFGSTLSVTVLPAIKPIGPALRQLQGSVTGGSGTGIVFDVYVTHRRG